MKLSNIVIGLVIAATPAIAVASYVTPQPPSINTSKRIAIASLVAARAAADVHSQAKCGVHAYPAGGAAAWGMCFITDGNGVSASCVSSDPEVIAAMRSLDNESYLYFTWDENAQCTDVLVYTGSQFKP